MIEHIEVFPAYGYYDTTPALSPHGARLLRNGHNVGRIGNELYSTRSSAVRAARQEALVRKCTVTLVTIDSAFVKYL